MDPRAARCRGSRWRLPRTRGDGPVPLQLSQMGIEASPHTRGWTPDQRRGRAATMGFPAHAGMDPGRRLNPKYSLGLPRTRGDGPILPLSVIDCGMASPHTRGWTPSIPHRCSSTRGFPAHAGMDPVVCCAQLLGSGLPRTRGDGPLLYEQPRGIQVASPHTRGWTRGGRDPGGSDGGFPAHAGMDRGEYADRQRPRGLPRTRGDGPWQHCARMAWCGASPHTRGWTPRRRDRLGRGCGFPAHAGMDPSRAPACPGSRRLPRTRGDGPCRKSPPVPCWKASPHTRGWTPTAGGR